MPNKKIQTLPDLREMVGTGGAIDTTHHEGETPRRPTERRALGNLGNWSPKKKKPDSPPAASPEGKEG